MLNGNIRIPVIGWYNTGAGITIGAARKILFISQVIDAGIHRNIPSFIAKAKVHYTKGRNSAINRCWRYFGIGSIGILLTLISILKTNIKMRVTHAYTASEYNGWNIFNQLIGHGGVFGIYVAGIYY